MSRLRCNGPRCRNLAVTGRSKCQEHGRSDPASHGDYGHGWQRMRAEIIKPDTLCARCHRRGTVNDPLELDHILPWVRGGTNDRANVQPVHRSYNRAKGGGHKGQRCAV